MHRGHGAKSSEGSASFGARHPSKTGFRDDPHVTGQTGSVPSLGTAIVRGLGYEEGRTHKIWGSGQANSRTNSASPKTPQSHNVHEAVTYVARE